MQRALGLTPLLAVALLYACNSVEVSPLPDTPDDAGPDAPGSATEGGSTSSSSSGGTSSGEPPKDAGATDGSSSGDAGTDGGDAGDDAAVDGGSDAGVDAGSPYVPFDINHVLITGQSNAVSNSGTPVLSTTQPYTNVMFDTGVMPMKGCNGNGCTQYDAPAALLPLVEGDKFFNYAVETAAAGLANQASFLATTKYALAGHDVLVSNHGRSGNTYWCLRKPVAAIANTTNTVCNYKNGYLAPFSQGMMEVQSGKDLAAAAGKSYAVRAVATIHGESDDYSYASGGWEFPLDGHDGTNAAIADYADALLEWQNDYETSIQAITGQTVPVPLFVSQISGWNHGPYSKVAQNQLDAHVKAPGKVVLIGPSYHLALNQGDCLHFTNAGERRLGEYFAKVYAHVVFAGKTWEPLRPKSVTRTNEVITVQFHVPKPPLVIDEALVAAAANEGFRYVDASGAAAPAITGVAITGPDTVQITLASAPTGANKRLYYAMNQVKNTCIGTPSGARGNLRDSDDTPSRTGTPLYNWAVHFDVAVP